MDLMPNRERNNQVPGHRTRSVYDEQPDRNQPTDDKKHTGLTNFLWKSRTMRYSVFVILIGCALLMFAVSLFLARQNFENPETKKVKTGTYQAVFINNTKESTVQSAVYFGKITSLNDKFIALKDVFYIQPQNTSGSSEQNQSEQLKLIKLGGELHAPEDEMIINKNQVLFWENLKESGQVVSKIKEYKANPSAAQQQNNDGQSNQ